MEPTKLPINQTSQYNYPQVGFPKKTIILNNGVLTSPNIESQIFRVCNPTDTTGAFYA